VHLNASSSISSEPLTITPSHFGHFLAELMARHIPFVLPHNIDILPMLLESLCRI